MINSKNYPEWYMNQAVKFEIIKFTKNKEFCLIVPKQFIGENNITTTMMKVHSVQHFDYVLKQLKVVTSPYKLYNLYTSVARYKNGIPNQTMNLALRNNSEWKKNHWKQIDTYDCFIDIDADSHSKIEMDSIWISAHNIIKELDELDCPYYLRFSGRGFHIVIPEQFFKFEKIYDPQSKNSIYSKFLEIAKYFYNKHSEMVDLSIYDSKRKIKLPYSLALYNSGSYICLPLNTLEEFYNFDLNYFNSNNWSGSSLKGRGQRLYNPNGDATLLLKKVGLFNATRKL